MLALDTPSRHCSTVALAPSVQSTTVETPSSSLPQVAYRLGEPSTLASRYLLPAGRNVTGVPSNRIRYTNVTAGGAPVTDLISKATLGTPAGGFVAEAS